MHKAHSHSIFMPHEKELSQRKKKTDRKVIAEECRRVVNRDGKKNLNMQLRTGAPGLATAPASVSNPH